MRYLNCFFVIVCSFVASLIFILLVFIGDSFLSSWFFMELSFIVLIPVFFIRSSYFVVSSLFSYIVFGSLSSFMYVLGQNCSSIFFLFHLGFYVKFGLFPFCFWVYHTVVNVNWVVIFVFSLFHKSLVIFLAWLIYEGADNIFFFSAGCGLTLVYTGVFFWLYSFTWKHCWCHMLLSSSSILFLLSLTGCEEHVFILYCVYCIWGSLCILFLGLFAEGVFCGSVIPCIFYLLIFLNGPFSIALFYKLVAAVNILSTPWWFIIFWLFYTFSEQCYYYSYLTSFVLPKKISNWDVMV